MWQLERISPAEKRGERIDLDPARRVHRVGRARHCEVRLYSAAASREHAEIRLDETDRWWIVPRSGRRVLADGEPVGEACELCEGLSLAMGRDRLRCHAGAAVAMDAARAPQPAPRLARSRRRVGWLLLAALAALALGTWWLRGAG